ncbi:MAG: hypothetical protein HND52_09160 [Ignavibacteriae bacterium]|nr:hypothetical protein [Ignavibacteriota bacterium]NOG98118.1 hypothetical protein [Ignavibacteriota bacterium]
MKNYNQTLFQKLMAAMVVLFFMYGIISAQPNQNDLDEKIKNIKDDIEKIIINAGGEEYTFTGDDAKELFKRLKSENDKRVMVKVIEGVDDGGTVWVTKGNDDVNVNAVFEDEYEFHFEEEGENGEKIKKEIEVEVEDGEKKVTVTTTKNGEETTEVFEGEEAEEFLKNSKHSKKYNIKIYDDEDLEWTSEGDVNMIFISEEMEGEEGVEKEIKINIEDGKKKVTVKTTKDGKEDVKIYEGDEADEYLEKMKGDGHGVKFFSSDDNVFIMKKGKIDGKNDDDLIEVIVDKDSKKKKMKKIIIKKEKDRKEK